MERGEKNFFRQKRYDSERKKSVCVGEAEGLKSTELSMFDDEQDGEDEEHNAFSAKN